LICPFKKKKDAFDVVWEREKNGLIALSYKDSL